MTSATPALEQIVIPDDQKFPRIGAPPVDPVQSTVLVDFRPARDERINLTVKQATRYVQLPKFKGERDPCDAHVERIRNSMLDGTFNPLQTIIVTAKLLGIVHKLNSQHTSWARIYCPDEPRFDYEVRAVHYDVKTLDELRLLYSTMDRGRTRTPKHLTKVQLIGTEVDEDFASRTLSAAIGGFRLWHFESEQARASTSPEHIATLIRSDFASLFRRVCRFITSVKGERLARRHAFVAAMFETFSKADDETNTEFWRPTILGTNLPTENDPRWRLRHMFISEPQSISKQSRYRHEALHGDEESSYRLCILAWNKWQRNETQTQVLRVPQDRQRALV